TLCPIRTEKDYEAALALVEPYFDDEPAPDSKAGAHFDALLTLIEAWEAKHQPVPPPHPIEAIKFRMEQGGLSPRDLEPSIGRLNRVYEVLTGKRSLTLRMIRQLHQSIGVPLDALVAESRVTESDADRKRAKRTQTV